MEPNRIWAYPGSLIYSEEERALTVPYIKESMLDDHEFLRSQGLMKAPKTLEERKAAIATHDFTQKPHR